jgi:hypothetical protein
MIPLVTLLTGIALHDVTHTLDILRALPERRTDVAEWLGNCDMSRLDPQITARRA